MLVGMSKKVYKEMLKEMKIISSQEDVSKQQHASEVCDHSFILLCISNSFIILNTNFQLFCHRK
jgi:predicted ribosome-associated RNA-binding protein Tma20